MLSTNNVANKTKKLGQPEQNKPIGTIHVLLHLENKQILKIISRFHKLYGGKTSIIFLPPLGSFSIKLGSDVGPIPGWGIFTPSSPEKFKIFFFWKKLF